MIMKLQEWIDKVEARLAALEGKKKPAPKKKAPAKKTKKK